MPMQRLVSSIGLTGRASGFSASGGRMTLARLVESTICSATDGNDATAGSAGDHDATSTVGASGSAASGGIHWRQCRCPQRPCLTS